MTYSSSSPATSAPHDKRRMNRFFFLLKNRHSPSAKKAHYEHSNPNPLSPDHAIFGTPLEAALQCSSAMTNGLRVPTPVYTCISTILERGLSTEGLFRLPGAAAQVDELQARLNEPPYGKELDLAPFDIHTVTSVLKKFLRQLPDAVIPTVYHERFLSLYDTSLPPHDEKLAESLGLLIAKLPKPNQHLLRYILLLAAEVQQHAENNMMNPEALAVVLAPACTGLEQALKNLPHTIKSKKKKLGKEDMTQLILPNEKWIRLWQVMIEHQKLIANTFLKKFNSLPITPRSTSLPFSLSSLAYESHIGTIPTSESALPALDILPVANPSAPAWLEKDPYATNKPKSHPLRASSLSKNNHRRILRRLVSATSLRSVSTTVT